MKHKLSFQVAVWWLILCAIAGIFLLAATDKHARESEEENRMLAGFPAASLQSVADASFMSGVEDYLSDAFIGRARIRNFVTRLTGVFNTLSSDDRMDKATVEIEKKLAAEGAAQETVTPAAPVEEIDDVQLAPGETLLTQDKSYVWLRKVGGGTKVITEYPRANVVTYAETLRLMLNYLPADGQIYFSQSPLASIANRWITQPDAYCGWGSSMETVLAEEVRSDRIHIFNTMEILEKPLAQGKYLFYRTDHHWTAEGAYLVAREMLASQGLPVAPYDEFAYKSIQSAVDEEGNQDTFDVLYPLLPTRSLVITHQTQGEEIPLMNYRSTTYRSFMNNTRTPWRRILTGVNNGRKALVICDSYGNAFTPYLLPYYDEVHMTDFRNDYYDKALAGGSIGEMMRFYGINDVYIIISTSNDLRKDNSLVYLRKYLTE